MNSIGANLKRKEGVVQRNFVCCRLYVLSQVLSTFLFSSSKKGSPGLRDKSACFQRWKALRKRLKAPAGHSGLGGKCKGVNQSALCSASFSRALSPSPQLSEHQTTGTAVSTVVPPRTHLAQRRRGRWGSDSSGRPSMPLFFCQDFKLHLGGLPARLCAEDYAFVQSESRGTDRLESIDALSSAFRRKVPAFRLWHGIFPD